MVKIKEEKGFSLIEMMIVIGILAILVAIAAPQWNVYVRNNALKSAARDLAGDIQIIRQRAMAGSPSPFVALPYTLQFLDGTRYTFTLPADLAPFQAIITTKNIATFYPDIKFLQITFPGNQIQFQARGTMALWGQVILTNDRGSQVTLKAIPPAGRINVTYNMQ